jgi:hypothetical protein
MNNAYQELNSIMVLINLLQVCARASRAFGLAINISKQSIMTEVFLAKCLRNSRGIVVCSSSLSGQYMKCFILTNIICITNVNILDTVQDEVLNLYGKSYNGKLCFSLIKVSNTLSDAPRHIFFFILRNGDTKSITTIKVR